MILWILVISFNHNIETIAMGEGKEGYYNCINYETVPGISQCVAIELHAELNPSLGGGN